LRDPRLAQLHDGELRGHEEGVHRDERQGEQDAQGVRGHRRRADARRRMLEDGPGVWQVACVTLDRAARILSVDGRSEAAGGGRMRSGVVVWMGCALLLCGAAAASATDGQALTRDELRVEMDRNATLKGYVQRNGPPDLAEY